MSIQTVKNFQGCNCAVENFPDPETGEIAIRVLVIINEEDNEIYRYPMAVEQAKTLGGQLMGMGSVAIASPSQVVDLSQHAHRNGRKR